MLSNINPIIKGAIALQFTITLGPRLVELVSRLWNPPTLTLNSETGLIELKHRAKVLDTFSNDAEGASMANAYKSNTTFFLRSVFHSALSGAFYGGLLGFAVSRLSPDGSVAKMLKEWGGSDA